MGTVFRYAVLGIFTVLCQTVNAGDTPIYPIPTTCPVYDDDSVVVHIQHESDCTKFYTCDHGQKVLQDCPGGLHFNPVLQDCDWPQNAGCTASGPSVTTLAPATKPPATRPPPTNPPTTRPPPPPSTRPPLTPTTTNPPSKQPTTIAPATPTLSPDCPFPDPLNYTVHLPHEDCTKFYKCDNGKKVEFDCPDGLHFNPVLEVCDWPYRAGCDGSTPPPKPATPTKAPATPTKAPPTPTKAPSAPTPSPECPFPDPLNYTVHLPHETDCTKFYKCDNGKKVEFDCPDGLHFNPLLEVCDWPYRAGCEGSTPPPKPPTPTKAPATPTKAPSTPTKAPPTPTKAPSAPTPSPECPFPDPLNYTVHLPHETDCTKFYKCDNGKKVEFDCPDGLHFNPLLEVCDWPYRAGCEGSTPPPKPPTSTKEPATPTKAPPTPTKAPSAPTPSPECPFPDPLNYTVHLPHETDCTKFYKCDNGKKVEFDCPGGLHFNPVLEVCDWPYRAGCEGSTTSPKPPPPPPPSPTTSTTQAPKDPNDDLVECDDEDLFIEHECECYLYYECIDGNRALAECPSDQYFNNVTLNCEPDTVGCRPTTTPSPTTTPTPTTTPSPTTTPTPTTTPPPTTTTPTPTTTTPTPTTTTPTPTTTTTPSPTTTTPTPTTTTPTPTTTTEIPTTTDACPPCDDTRYRAVPGSRYKFSLYVGGREIVEECPNGLVFDSELALCNLAQMVDF